MVGYLVGSVRRSVSNLLCLSLIIIPALLSACGGGSSGGTPPVASSTPTLSSSSSSSSSLPAIITLSGNITYDFVPHAAEQDGLDYTATVARPGRGLLVELLDANNQVLTSTISSQTGAYSLNATRDKLVRVRVKAQLLSESDNSAQWDFKVTDNTSNNSVYAMAGSLLAANEATAARDLHASSGWGGSAYSQPRVAAPFAIIDSIFTGVERLLAVDDALQFPTLELRWSQNNNTADGDLALGEIATSFYSSDLNAIYILGSENDDTDEYDRHVILHEWGHYIEATLSRSDTIGGSHQGDDKLDLRVAMSEGFSNAFSAMLLDDPVYRDTSGVQQSDDFRIAVNRIDNTVRGWYSEASVQSIFYNFYASDTNKTARDIADVFTVIRRDNYINSDAFVSIYLFAEQLRTVNPTVTPTINSLLSGQNIAITDRFGANESNSGGAATHLPIYKTLPLNNTAVNVCSTNNQGAYNKLGVSQFLLLNVVSAGNYRITATESGTASSDSDPDMYLYFRGEILQEATSAMVGSETLTHSLLAGAYVLELVDDRAVRDDFNGNAYACFDVRAFQLN